MPRIAEPLPGTFSYGTMKPPRLHHPDISPLTALIIAVALAFIGGCEFLDPDSERELVYYSGVQSVYKHREPIKASLVNASEHALHVRTICNDLEVDRRVNGTWRELYRDSSVCHTGFSSVLEPGGERTLQIRYEWLEQVLEDPAGTYRFRHRLYLDDNWQEDWMITSTAFSVH